ncbi:MAG TPA: glycosyltransferase [Marmoricola sp.]|nr:glycosyltransferase [Marmoricola sp.]
MLTLLSTVVVCAVVLDALALASLFVGEARRPRLSTAVRTALAAVSVGVAALGGAAALGAGPSSALASAVLLTAAVLAWGPVAGHWTARGLLVWSLSVVAGLAYLAYVAAWIVTASLHPAGFVGATLLWALEVFVFVLATGYVWELVDVLARWDWRRGVAVGRQVGPPGRHVADSVAQPFVSLHVPTHNEPPDLVIATLGSLLALEYDDYEVLLLDNNTDDPALWQPVADFCARHDRLRFFHLEDWPGYKSGALNFGLQQTDPRAEVVGVVDSDYQVRPDFLARCAPLFADSALAFVQTPQDYRDWETDSYFRRLYYSYAYFFDVSQRSRNERDGAIFGGTMGLIRRRALEQVGGWDEWCITEDAELSLRLLRAGWQGSHVAESFGRGIMPLTFEALKRQRFRWCFGGVQILRMHWRSLLPGRQSAGNRLDNGQRWAYLVGGLQWFGDLVGLLFTVFLLLGALDVATGSGLVLRRLSGLMLVCVVGLVLLGSLRSVALVHRATGARWRDAFGAFGLWLALGWSVSLGAVRGLVAREGAFLRTPKTRGDVGWRDAVRGNVVESALAVVCAAAAAAALGSGSPGGVAVAALLLVQGAGHAAAPYNSLAAVRADLTPELRRRRREKMLSWTRVSPGVRRWGIGPVLAAGLGGLLLMVVAAPVGAPRLGPMPGAAAPTVAPVRTSDRTTPRPGRTAAAQTAAAPGSPAAAITTATAQAAATPRSAAASPTGARPTPVATTRAASASPRPSATPTTRPTATPTAPRSVATTPAPTRRPTARPTGRPTSSPTHP